MNKIQNTIENVLYTYQPGEFLPVYMGGELQNRNEFIAYKAERFAKAAGRGAVHAAENTYRAVAFIVQHAAQQ